MFRPLECQWSRPRVNAGNAVQEAEWRGPAMSTVTPPGRLPRSLAARNLAALWSTWVGMAGPGGPVGLGPKRRLLARLPDTDLALRMQVGLDPDREAKLAAHGYRTLRGADQHGTVGSSLRGDRGPASGRGAPGPA